VCPSCHQTTSLPICWTKHSFNGEAIDPVFGLPLWLQVRCRGGILWAYNGRHLNELQAYVAATLRVRTNMANGQCLLGCPNGSRRLKTEIPYCAP
jgi:hypothetical protein